MACFSMTEDCMYRPVFAWTPILLKYACCLLLTYVKNQVAMHLALHRRPYWLEIVTTYNKLTVGS